MVDILAAWISVNLANSHDGATLLLCLTWGAVAACTLPAILTDI